MFIYEIHRNNAMNEGPVRVGGWLSRRYTLLLGWALIAAGIALFLLSLTPEIHRVGTARFSGLLEPGAITSDTLNHSGYGFARVAFETRPSCALRLYVLNEALAESYQSSGVLPNPDQSLNCDQPEAVVREPIVLLVFQNSRNESAEPYSVVVELFVQGLPYGLAAFPGIALFIFAATVLLVQGFLGGLRTLEEELRGRRTLHPRGQGVRDEGPAGEVASRPSGGLRSSLPEREQADEEEMQE